MLIVIDQFEEIETLCSEEERNLFMNILFHAVNKAPSFTLLLTLRIDYLTTMLRHKGFDNVLQNYPPLLSNPMNQHELQEVLEKPAQAMKVELEEGLARRLIQDVENQPGFLPLLQFSLAKLWEKQQNWFLTHKAYEEIGGLNKALAHHANQVFNNLNTLDKKRVERIFTQLVCVREKTSDTRRIATYTEIGEENWNLVNYLASKEILLVVTGFNKITGEETVEIIHEALITHWSLLRQWVDKIKNNLKYKQKIEDAAIEWINNQEEEDYLFRGDKLKNAELFLCYTQKNKNYKLSRIATKFINTSKKRESRTSIKSTSFNILYLVFTVCLLMQSVFSRGTNTDQKAIEVNYKEECVNYLDIYIPFTDNHINISSCKSNKEKESNSNTFYSRQK